MHKEPDRTSYETRLILWKIIQLERNIMATDKQQAEVARQQSIALDEIASEQDALIQAVKDLTEAAANQDNASPELVEAMEVVTAKLKVIAEKVPNAPPVE